MGDIPKQSMFFIQDPYTEEVKGPLTAQQLKQWFAQGSFQEWGVSKSSEGPWTPAAQVKGLAPAKKAETAHANTAIAQQPPAATVASPPAKSHGGNQSPASSKAKVSAALDWAKQHYPKSLVGRVLVTVAGLWVSLLLLCGIPLGIGIVWSETFGAGAAARQAMQEAEAQAVRTEAALRDGQKQVDQAMEQLEGTDAYRKRVIRDAEYERAKRERGR
jgi:hypothetical protein